MSTIKIPLFVSLVMLSVVCSSTRYALILIAPSMMFPKLRNWPGTTVFTQQHLHDSKHITSLETLQLFAGHPSAALGYSDLESKLISWIMTHLRPSRALRVAHDVDLGVVETPLDGCKPSVLPLSLQAHGRSGEFCHPGLLIPNQALFCLSYTPRNLGDQRDIELVPTGSQPVMQPLHHGHRGRDGGS